MKFRILIISVAVFLLSIFLLYRYYTNAEENSINEKISIAESLIKSGKEATAIYDSVYTEFKHRGEVKSKHIKYSFTVDGKKIEDEKSFEEAPAEPIFTIIYLPSDPTIHAENPKADLELLNKLKLDKASGFWPWILFIGSIAIFFVTRRSYLNDLTEAKDMERFYREMEKQKK
ncbi:MAG TPA: hypothetical protein VGQ59_02900 [Cyclobacteriaceae bacterium]|jgi:hypothetical protein|nr:hypothetical protein [Cyclobacteriaceae bacterium]